MRFYAHQKQFYCGIDLHARNIYICIIDRDKKVLVHRNLRNQDTVLLLKILNPFRNDLIVACESTYAWYWLADFCADNDIEFILGHALYMKAIHGGKTKNDRIDSHKIALLAAAGMFPLAYVYPRKKRYMRDLLRRRLYFIRIRADLLSHVQLVNHQVNLPALGRLSKSRKKRDAVYARFAENEPIERSVNADLRMINYFDEVIKEIESYILEHVRKHHRKDLNILQSVNGIGDIIALTILYETDDITRFSTVQHFASYCRLVRCTHESAGKKYPSSGKKIGNVHLKYIFSEASVYVVKFNPQIQKFFNRLENKKGKAKAYSIVAHKIARAVYYMLKDGTVFDEKRFLKC